MVSELFQIKLKDSDLTYFQTPASQPAINPKNCGAVTGQLLGLVNPKTANEMTILGQGVYPEEWRKYMQNILHEPISLHYYQISDIQRTFQRALFPGFGTIVGIYPESGSGHWFVIAKRLDNSELVILDPQIRRGFQSFQEYFNVGSWKPSKFGIFLRSSPKSETQHYQDGLSIALKQCALQEDVVMEGTGRRKRRKTKRRLLAKRTLRRVNRRRRIL
jgi:hypothetical protein